MYNLELSYSERDFLFQLFTIKADFSLNAEKYKPVYQHIADMMKESLSDKSPAIMHFSAHEFEIFYFSIYSDKESVYSQVKRERLNKQTRKKLKRIQ